MPVSESHKSQLELIDGGLRLLLDAVHANDPKREILVRIGDLMRDVSALTAALSDQVVVRRAWLTDVRDQMMKMKLESGPAGDFIFLLREMFTDILDRPSPSPPSLQEKT